MRPSLRSLASLFCVDVCSGEATLEEFEHPDRAVYILGSEDTGLPQSVVKACHRHGAPAHASRALAMSGTARVTAALSCVRVERAARSCELCLHLSRNAAPHADWLLSFACSLWRYSDTAMRAV